MAFTLRRKKEGLSPPPPRPVSFRQYVDATGELSSQSLGWSLWLVRHKIRIQRFAVATLIIFDVATVAFSGWRILEYLIVGRAQDNRLLKQLSQFQNYAIINSQRAPAPLLIESATLLPGGADSFDAVASVANPNSHWQAEFDYYFLLGAEPTTRQRAQFLPGERRPLPSFSVSGASSVTLVVEELKWRRVSAHLVANPEQFQAERLNFAVSNFIFRRAAETASAPLAAMIGFTFINKSPYSYAAPEFLVGLYQGETLMGVLPLALSEFRSQESRAIDLRRFVSNERVDNIRVFPLIDVYNAESYLALPPSS